LGLIFFTIAAVIIMSLIPLYLKSKPVTTQPAFYRSAPQTARLPIQNDGTFTPGDTLNEQGRTAIANQVYYSAISFHNIPCNFHFHFYSSKVLSQPIQVLETMLELMFKLELSHKARHT